MQQKSSKMVTTSSAQDICLGFSDILSRYLTARAHDALDASHTLWRQAKHIQASISQLKSVVQRPNLQVRWSFGQGAWARIPWIALIDTRETRATSGGVYVIYLFREDMSGAYLTLNQGVTREVQKLGSVAARNYIRGRADALRRYCGELPQAGFSLDGNIDLRSNSSLGRDYQMATIAHILYEPKDLKTDRKLIDGLAQALIAYDKYLADKLQQG